MASRIRLRPLVVSLGAAVIMALLLSGSAGAWEGTSTSQPQRSLASPQQAVLGSAGNSVTLEQPPLCRYGVSAWGADQLKWLPTWRAGWTLDFGAHAPVPGVVAEFAQVIRVQQNKNGCTYLDGYSITPALTEEGLGAVIRAAPGFSLACRERTRSWAKPRRLSETESRMTRIQRCMRARIMIPTPSSNSATPQRVSLMLVWCK